MTFSAGQKPPAADLDQAVQKIMARGRRTTSSTTTTTIVGVLRLDDIVIKSGYSYRISAACHPNSTVAADQVEPTIRYTIDGSTPDTASSVLPGGHSIARITTASAPVSKTIETIYEAASDQTLSLLLCVARTAGTGNAYLYATSTAITEIRVDNSGPNVGDTGVDI